MPLPATGSLETLTAAELREMVGGLLVEMAALRAALETQQTAMVALKAENQALRDEVARLKGLPPRPSSRPSGMEKATGGGKTDSQGAKRDRDAVSREMVVKAAAPTGSLFKGYQDLLVRELVVSAEVVRLRRERWLTPLGETILAPLPAGIGIEISKRQVVRLLTSRLLRGWAAYFAYGTRLQAYRAADMGLAEEAGFQRYHDVLSRARRDARAVARRLLLLLIERLLPEGEVVVGLDDSIERRWGARRRRRRCRLLVGRQRRQPDRGLRVVHRHPLGRTSFIRMLQAIDPAR